MDVADKLVSTGVAARELGVHMRTFQRWIAQGWVTPDYTTPGGHHRWNVDRLRGLDLGEDDQEN